jgi:DNA-nicking Smr family endonuclease
MSGKEAPPGPVERAAPPVAARLAASPAPAQRPAPSPRIGEPPLAIEPNRERRIMLGREPIGARIDLHGMSQDQARSALTAFLIWAQAEGHRAVLVITGRGYSGEGVLRRRAPEWLAHAPLRALVAGISTARRRHGGEGALYVALRRAPRPA